MAMLLGCGGGATGPGGDSPADFTFADPAADTAVAVANPNAVKAIDLITVSGSRSAKTLDLRLEFAEAISPWSDGAANGLDGFIYIDADQAPTGFPDPGHDMGVDFYVDLRDNGAGKVALVNVAKRTISTIKATITGTSFSVSLPTTLLAVTTDTSAALNLAVVVSGRGRLPVADSAPNAVRPIVVRRVP